MNNKSNALSTIWI